MAGVVAFTKSKKSRYFICILYILKTVSLYLKGTCTCSGGGAVCIQPNLCSGGGGGAFNPAFVVFAVGVVISFDFVFTPPLMTHPFGFHRSTGHPFGYMVFLSGIFKMTRSMDHFKAFAAPMCVTSSVTIGSCQRTNPHHNDFLC